jgi:hypothetical protein
MSQIPVSLSIMIQKDEALASLMEFQQGVQNIVNEMQSNQVAIPLNIDQNALTAQLAEVRTMVAAIEPIAIPAMLDTSGFQAQLDFVRETMAAQPPIEIPVKMVNQGGDGSPGGGDGGAGGGESVAAAAGMMAGTSLRKLFIELEVIRAGFDLAEAGGEMAKGWAFNRATPHNEQEFEQYGHGAEQSRKDTLKDVEKIPIIGSVMAEGADQLNRLGGATKNFLKGKGFESDAGYTERMEGDSKAIEEHTKKIHEEAEARAKIVEGLNKDTERYSLEAKNDNTKGAFDRTINTIDSQRMDVMEEYRYAGPMAANAKNFDAHGHLLPEAVRARDAVMGELDARENKARDDVNYQLGDEAARNLIAQDELSGDSAKGRKDAFNYRIGKERDAAYKRSHDEGDYFDKHTAITEQQEFAQNEQHRNRGMADESRYTVAESRARVDEIRGSMNHDPVAEAQAKNQAIDANVRKLQDAANNEIDLEKKKQLEIRATSALREADAEKAKNIADANRELYDRATSATETRDRAHGGDYDADKLEIQRRFNDHEISTDQRDAELDSIEQRRQKEFRGMRAETAEYEYRTTNRPKYAELTAIEDEIGEQRRKYAKDPEMLEYINQRGAAQLTAFAHPESRSQWYSSAADYAKSLNTGVLNQDQNASKEALKAAKILKEGGTKFEQLVDKLLDGPGLHIIRSGY